MTVLKNARDAGTGPYMFRATPERPLALLARCPVYARTPLAEAPGLAREIGIGALWLKDESRRMRLGSFKALGGVFAVAQLLSAAVAGGDPAGEAARRAAAQMLFVTASAGNHGLAVAAGARIFGARATIFLDETVSEDFEARIRSAGAAVRRVAGSYEDAVSEAETFAAREGATYLADGSWPGYTERPALIMEGYTVLAEECRAAFQAQGAWPDMVALQAGVGGMAAAVAAHIRSTWPVQPAIAVVEPDRAACLLESTRAGALTRANGEVSAMGRLDCKDASLVAFEALRRDADLFVTVGEAEAAEAASLLARHGYGTTPSGAAGLAGLRALAPGVGARCLAIVSEGTGAS